MLLSFQITFNHNIHFTVIPSGLKRVIKAFVSIFQSLVQTTPTAPYSALPKQNYKQGNSTSQASSTSNPTNHDVVHIILLLHPGQGCCSHHPPFHIFHLYALHLSSLPFSPRLNSFSNSLLYSNFLVKPLCPVFILSEQTIQQTTSHYSQWRRPDL